MFLFDLRRSWIFLKILGNSCSGSMGSFFQASTIGAGQAGPVWIVVELRSLSNLRKMSKSGCVRYCNLGQHLAVEVDPCLFQAGDQTAIRDFVFPGFSVYANNPQTTKIAFLIPAVTIRIS